EDSPAAHEKPSAFPSRLQKLFAMLFSRSGRDRTLTGMAAEATLLKSKLPRSLPEPAEKRVL
ncbi:MAG: hypothetical protein P1P81_06355, partial [Desulfobulbales bacterium]|nr:hypothetical protein [Desulfobulbales bacterium]